MNRYDDENKIVEDFQQIKDGSVFFAIESDEAEAVYQSIHMKDVWVNWVNSSGKSDSPPDFYLKTEKLMMDVMRVDDHAYPNEKGKIKNPVTAGESQLRKELQSSGILEMFPNANVVVNAKTTLPIEQDHNYDFYRDNFERVVFEHIKKVPLYNENHPGYRVVLFVMDESSAYMQCVGKKPDLSKVKVDDCIKALPHLFFFDKAFVSVFANKPIDYLIWFAPFKLSRTTAGIIDLPQVVIYDCKELHKLELQDYDCTKMCSTEL